MIKTTEVLETVDESQKADAPEQEVTLTSAEEAEMKAMIENHVFYGHAKSKTNPKNRKNIAATRSGIEVIDLLKTMKSLENVSKLIKDKVSKGGTILFVGTTPAAKFAIKETAVRLGMPYIIERWLGGTLTNFKTISSRVAHFKKLEDDKKTGRWEKYTKKERVGIDRELNRFEKLLRGISNMDRNPSLVFVADLGTNEIAAHEAKRMKIPSIAIVNTTSDPDLVDYAIPANDRNSKSISYILSKIETAVSEGRAAAKAAEEARLVNAANTPKA